MREGFCVGEIVHRDKIEIGDTLFFRGPQHLPSDTPESVDSYPCCHSLSSSRLKPVATCVRTAKGHVANDSRSGFVKNLRAFVERRRGRDDVVYYYNMRPEERASLSAMYCERACNVALPLFGCQPGLRFCFTRAPHYVWPHRDMPSGRQSASKKLALIIATLSFPR